MTAIWLIFRREFVISVEISLGVSIGERGLQAIPYLITWLFCKNRAHLFC